MTLQPRFILRTLAATLGLALVLVTAVSAEVVARRALVGAERIAQPTLPAPVAAIGGGVYVPLGLKELPCLEVEDLVVDDPAVDIRHRDGGQPFGLGLPSWLPDVVAEAMGGDVDRAALGKGPSLLSEQVDAYARELEATQAGLRAVPWTRSAAPLRTTSVSANVRANDTSGDPAGSTQSENTIVMDGPNGVAGWNDGKNFGVSPGGTGFASTNNGGLTWTDGGVLPAPTATAIHEGDPCVTTDHKGNYYFSDLYTPDNNVTSAVAVCAGTFSGGVVVWNMPVMVASTLTDFLDKEWISADPGTGNVYCTYTRFLAAGGNQIEFSRSTTNGVTWDPPTVLTLTAVESVQGSRVAVGPSGEIQVIYFVYDKASGNNYMRTRRSTTFGTSWGPEVTLPTGPNGIFSNYGSGPAGFNRARGIGFPSLTIDRTGGANSGRVYATWEETINFYFDPLGSLGTVAEVEANNTPGTANPILIGQAITGTMSSTADQDWFSFSGTAGQTVIIYLVPGSPTPGDGFLRLFCGGGATANRAQLSYIGFGTGLCVYTLPSNGTYYFRVLANSATIGNYVVYTGYDAPDPGDEVARDTRDAIVQSSPDGVAWDVRRVVNDDPPRFDNAFPEVAVDGAGQVFIDWMDHRGDPCGIGTDVYYARSSNGSVTFNSSVKVNDGPPVNWSNVASNLAPNMGDYWSLVSDACNVYANFSDGRQGTPDSWVAVINDCATPTLISLANYVAMPDYVDLGWFASDGAGVIASVERRDLGGLWAALGNVRPDGTGRIAFHDATVRAGTTYEYRLGVMSQTGMSYFGGVTVDVPRNLSFAVRSLGNPVRGDLNVAFSLPSTDPGLVELLDVGGRVLAARKVSGSGTTQLGSGVRGGIYFLRLSQNGHSVSSKVVVFN